MSRYAFIGRSVPLSVSDTHRRCIANGLSLFVDVWISSSCAVGRLRSRLCVCLPAVFPTCLSAPAEEQGRGLEPLLQSVGRGYGASSRANRGRAVAFRRYRSTRRVHVPETYLQCASRGCAGCMPSRQMSPRNLICTRKRRIFISGSA